MAVEAVAVAVVVVERMMTDDSYPAA